MKSQHSPTILDRLAPTATRPERLRVRVRVGVGGAIVLMLAALVVTVLISAFAQQTSSRIGPNDVAGSAAPATAFDTGGTEPGAVVDSTTAPTVFVHVLGAVARPGVIELRDGSRVLDAIAAAGGLTPTADPAGANLARRVADGEQIYLPQQGELPAGAPPGIAAGPAAGGLGTGSAADTIVNLNSATPADLETLPRIGPAMAQRIVDYRTSNGPFGSIDELRNVTGIGDKTFDALRELVRV